MGDDDVHDDDEEEEPLVVLLACRVGRSEVVSADDPNEGECVGNGQVGREWFVTGNHNGRI